MVKRFNIYANNCAQAEAEVYIVYHSDGTCVLYNDYSALLQRFKNLVDCMDAVNIVLKLDTLQRKITHEKKFIMEVEKCTQ